MEHEFSIACPGLVLRPLGHGDIESLRIWRNDPQNSTFFRKIGEITPEAQENWYAEYLLDDTHACFAAEHDGKLVGSASLYDIEGSEAEFGRIMVGPADCKGKGFGSRLSYLTVKAGFELLGLNALRATVAVDNTAALIVYVRLGFCVTGRFHNDASGMDEFNLYLTRERFGALESQLPYARPIAEGSSGAGRS